MPAIKHQITPCLWFDTQAEEAAKFYVSIFENSRIKQISRYGKVGRETHGKEAGSVLTVEFELNGQTFVALNGGPQFKFNEVSLVPGDVRFAGRDRLFLEPVFRRRPREFLRLAEGQIRGVLANRAVVAAANAHGCRHPQIRARHGRASENEEVRSGDAATRVCGAIAGTICRRGFTAAAARQPLRVSRIKCSLSPLWPRRSPDGDRPRTPFCPDRFLVLPESRK